MYLGELSSARQVLEGAQLAPGSRETSNELMDQIEEAQGTQSSSPIRVGGLDTPRLVQFGRFQCSCGI